MKRRSAWILATLIGVCALIFATTNLLYAQDSGTLLRYKFTAGQLLRYNIKVDTTTTMTMSGMDNMPTIPAVITGVMRQRTTKILENGDAEVRVAFESMKVEVSGKQMPMNVASMPAITMVMSPNGQVKSTSGLDKMSGAFGMPGMNMGSMGQNYSAFPENTLKIGDTWTQDVPFPTGGTMKVEAQLLADTGGIATVKQKVVGNINMSQAVPNAGTAVNASGTLSSDGRMNFSTELGRMISATSMGTMHMNISAPGGPGTMVSDTQMTMVMTLIQ